MPCQGAGPTQGDLTGPSSLQTVEAHGKRDTCSRGCCRGVSYKSNNATPIPTALPECRHCHLHGGLKGPQGHGVALEPPDRGHLQPAAAALRAQQAHDGGSLGCPAEHHRWGPQGEACEGNIPRACPLLPAHPHHLDQAQLCPGRGCRSLGIGTSPYWVVAMLLTTWAWVILSWLC